LGTEAMDKAETKGYFRQSIMIVNFYAIYILLLALYGAVSNVRWIGGGKFSHENVFPGLMFYTPLFPSFFI
jgi:hypothetical protein